MATLKDLVEEWLSLDQNQQTRQEIQTLWDAGNTEELERRMRPRIEFGTAGLRGRMEAGWARMNDLIVIQTSQGLCSYVSAQVDDAATRGVVIGHDHRHNSERWARLAAAAFISGGLKVYFLQELVHTPMVPFSVKKLRAACGVMITASHNPKHDNGYKVYWENAVQIIPPYDEGISHAIKTNLQPRSWDVDVVQTSPLVENVTAQMLDEYFRQLKYLNKSRTLNETSGVKFINTSMHGVSDRFAARAFEDFGFQPYVPVEEQRQPDPEFPTVRFPNPEEKGALDLALKTADREGAPYVLAQDPDADRFSAAEKGANGEWTTFTGDQLGVTFGHHIFESYKTSGKPLDKLAMVASTVSSKMLEAIAKKEGFKFVECLTGFKYIGNTALDLVKQGYEVPFGYEEAIGFMFGSEIRDKDGIAATVSFAEIVTALHSKGKTVQSSLQTLYDRYGYFQTNNSYFICTDPSIIDKIFARIRSWNANEPPPSYPREIAGLTVTRVVDLTIGYDSGNPPTYRPSLPLSSGHMIQFRAENKADGTKITLTIRTSGTEPKIKYYLEGSGKDAESVSALLPKVVTEIGDIWLEAGKHGLGRP
ncbi:putative phosphoglucomutase/phosphomannomutase, alpha/beta/alpha domain III [Lyophyllum shimeji]|uniref:Phosphoglucomutase/phosphomannomutase, alpha/beta/alpha domain III n=1 Tax=Lyophyllum shimeji TaxID=47721 RepID=A0A9P3PFP9_LYOSH|nr:putative phosphoglucomutase/phosphomannomutase, alpha/beta/alpha domain III [Lyophyllum shimeji]